MRLALLTVVGTALTAPAAQAANPIACFTQSPSFPVPAQSVTFNSSCSHDPDQGDSITSQAWDLDNDGAFDDGTGVTASRSFPSAGTFTVRLFIRNNHGTTDTETHTVTVNAPPSASFTNTPAAPQTAELVTFNSTSTDSDGTISASAWDLDNDGSFDDGSSASASRSFATAGNYTVRLRVTDNRGAQTTSTRTIAVANRPPVASFTNTPSAPQSGEAVKFDSTSTDSDGTIVAYAWALDADGAFDDGTTASVSRTFTTPGDRTIKLKVTDNNGGETTSTRTISVGNRGPAAAFDIAPATASQPTGQSFTFTSASTDPDGTIASQAWDTDGDATTDFADGTGTSASKAFPTAGTYPVRLQVTDNSGATSTVTRNVTVTNRGPTSSFTYAPAVVKSGDNVTLTSNSTDPDGTIQSYAWALDADGAFDDGTAASVTRAFPTRGNFTAKLKVTDNSGAESISTQVISVENRPPIADFTRSIENPTTGQPLTFTSTSTDPDGKIVSYAWAIDADGAFDDGTDPTYTRNFVHPGVRDVKLKVTDNDGSVVIVTKTVNIANRLPVAAFDFSPAAPLVGQAVTFTSSSTDPDGTIASTAWALDADGVFDDGTGTTTTRTFTEPGRYTVKLRVRDDDRGETIQTRDVVVSNRDPVAAFGYAPAAPLAGDQITLTSSSSDADGTVARQEWDVDGDGVYDDGVEGATATVTFPDAGLHVIGLRVTDDRGATSTATQTISVGALPEAPRTSTDTSVGQTFDTSVPVGPTATPPPIVAPIQPLRWLDPFPTVRIRGRTTPTGARLSLFSVRAPADSIVTVRCDGPGCPVKKLATKVKTRKNAASGTARVTRIERNLRAGVVLQVYVTKEGLVGKYTRFKIRRIALPIREDRCLMPNSTRPVGCPAAP